ncbi:MAG: hypothetical protein Q8K07_01940 [Methylicorpusculum sp.]|uniref:hypothetical protein n=1 Tax=Methylicorpusculum sp. TaxID=2713644 RepID=UPI002728979C|nr:hypothetical protein [Methylicorpusculum sp.]MDO8846640.1 hypothetical protein [Methylicorpusculum sp.]MDO9240757.1 hypothetical protein [Methylicorpusculum sp.]MDP2200755.1 hypothetical protein [Methylicorpusculum sp.]
MKINNLTQSVFIGILIASPLVNAESDYPAADFKPKVLYQDSEYKSAAVEEVKSESKSSAAAAESEDDSKFPAANFKPEVLYKDENYKPSKIVEAPVSKNNAGTTEVWKEEIKEIAKESSQAKKESSSTPLIALVALAVGGFLFFKSRGTASTGSVETKVYTRDPSGLTGVARYLDKKNPRSSSVAKYIEKLESTPKSSVDKYLAKKVVADKSEPVSKATGVEKYLRDRG